MGMFDVGPHCSGTDNFRGSYSKDAPILSDKCNKGDSLGVLFFIVEES